MKRFAGTFGTDADAVVDFSSNLTIDSTTDEEVLSVSVEPRGEGAVEVVLNAHITLQKRTNASGEYGVTIRRGDCSGAVVGRAWWLEDGSASNDIDFETDTFPVTGVDTVSSDATYKLCVGKRRADDATATASMRGLMAIWLPTS